MSHSRIRLHRCVDVLLPKSTRNAYAETTVSRNYKRESNGRAIAEENDGSIRDVWYCLPHRRHTRRVWTTDYLVSDRIKRYVHSRTLRFTLNEGDFMVFDAIDGACARVASTIY